MKLHRLVIHELFKESGTTDVDFTPSTALLTIEESLSEMIANIHESFEKSISSYHRFKPHSDRKAIFVNASKYVKKEETDDRFYKWSANSMRELAAAIEQKPFATGGYYIFSDYEINYSRFLSIVIVRDKDAFNVTWNKNTKIYHVNTMQNIDIDQMAMGFRLNVNLYKAVDQRNYIAVISRKSEAVSQYFRDWVCIDEGTSSRSNTTNLVRILKHLPQPDDFQGDEDEFLVSVFNVIDSEQKAQKGIINVDRLSEMMYKDRSFLRNYAQQEFDLELDPEFKVHTTALRSLVRYKAKTKGISVSLDVEQFRDNTVELTEGTVIIRSRSIFEQLWSQRNEDD